MLSQEKKKKKNLLIIQTPTWYPCSDLGEDCLSTANCASSAGEHVSHIGAASASARLRDLPGRSVDGPAEAHLPRSRGSLPSEHEQYAVTSRRQNRRYLAVVGLDGLGKNNVGESIRWVLGDATSRSVRARRLEDAHPPGRARTGCGAGGSGITLDNSDGWLPLDYSEAEVARRAYRSGESEYLINRNKVRLRDVLDPLYAGAGPLKNSYAFMGQGLVEEVLPDAAGGAAPAAREAADARLLRTRLDEARPALGDVREPRAVVNCLIEEIAPRCALSARHRGR